MILKDYMNIFDPYAQGKPIEDNVSRALAITLDENLLLRERFIELINNALISNGEKLILKPESPEDFDVSIQQRASNMADRLEGKRRIIPVTLLPDTAQKEDKRDGAKNPETDICIVCGNGEISDLIIVEVKLYSTSAEGQVKHQAYTINEMDKTRDNVDVTPVVNLTWKDIVKLLLYVNALQEERDLVLGHYIEYLRNKHTNWFPAVPFSAGMTREEAWERIDVLVHNCAKKLDSIYENSGVSFSAGIASYMYGVFLNPKQAWGYMQQFHVCEDFSNDDGRFQGLTVAFWLGNNKPQSEYLFGTWSSTKKDMSWTESTTITPDGTTLKCSIRPYLKFYDVRGRQIMAAYPMLKALGTKKSEVLSKFPENGRWSKEHDTWSFANLKKRLLSADPAVFDEEEAKNFEHNFADKFENSNRTCLNIALGFEIEVNIPVEELKKRDKGFLHQADNQDEVAELVASVVKAVREMIEK